MSSGNSSNDLVETLAKKIILDSVVDFGFLDIAEWIEDDIEEYRWTSDQKSEFYLMVLNKIREAKIIVKFGR